MLLLIYISLAILFLITAFLIVHTRMYFLSRHPEVYDEAYDGHSVFLDRFFFVIRYYVRRLYVYVKLGYRHVLHIWVRFIAEINRLSEKLYMRSRDQFVKEVVKDKKAVPHFWSHLKKYKKEKDEEGRIDDDSINTIVK